MIRVCVVEDDARYRESLRTLFEVAPGLQWVEGFADGEQIVARAEALGGGEAPWDVVVSDMQMPGLDGIETTRRLKALYPDLRVLMLTVYEDAPTILRAICAGADGYLLKRAPVEELLDQVEAVAQGGAPLTPAVASVVLGVVRTLQPSAGPSEIDLSDREREVLSCLVEGMSYKQVAASLYISIDTVRTHIRRLYRKLRVHSVAEAVSRALREGLVDMPR